MAAPSCVANAAAKRGVTARRSDAPAQHRQQCGRKPVPIACGLHDDVRTTLTGQLPRPMGFVHRHPQQRRFLQALARQGGATPGMPQVPTAYRPYPGRSLLRLFELIPTAPPGALSFAAIACAQRTGLPLHFSSHSLHRRTRPRSHHFRLVVPPSGLPAGSKTDASFEALVSPEHHALALTGSRLGELAPTLTIDFQDNAARHFAWRPEDGRLDLYPAAALPAQP